MQLVRVGKGFGGAFGLRYSVDEGVPCPLGLGLAHQGEVQFPLRRRDLLRVALGRAGCLARLAQVRVAPGFRLRVVKPAQFCLCGAALVQCVRQFGALPLQHIQFDFECLGRLRRLLPRALRREPAAGGQRVQVLLTAPQDAVHGPSAGDLLDLAGDRTQQVAPRFGQPLAFRLGSVQRLQPQHALTDPEQPRRTMLRGSDMPADPVFSLAVPGDDGAAGQCR